MGPRSMSNTNQDDSFYDGGDPRPTLHRRKSAKMLIDQYETMHDGTTGRPPDLRSPSRSTRTAYRRPSPSNALLSSSNALRHRSTPATTFNATASASFYPSSSNANKKDSSTAPLKHSFKNLFSLLKKGKNGLMGPSERDKVIFPIAAAAANKKSAALAEEHKELPLLPIPLGDAQRPALSRSQTQMGALIYLTRYTPAGLDLSDDDKYPLSGIPLWAECTITLEGRKIAVSWSTPEGIPCARDIALVGCSDIRSVSPDLRSLEPEERKALPGVDEAGGGGESLKVFELLFKDRRPPERFAVASVRERAKWISAFWDAILSSISEGAEGKHGCLPNDQPQEAKGLNEREKRRPRSQPATRPSPPTPIRTNTDRSLPPIPVSRTLSYTQEIPVVPPLSIPSRSGASLRTTRPMTRTDTNKTSTTVLLPAPSPGRLPMPISPVSAYSTASATSSRVQSPTRGSGSGLAKWPPPPPSMISAVTDAASSLSPPHSPTRWPSVGSDSAASSLISVPSLVRRANSPSITNLSRLSVVKGRLAQLERSLSQQSQGQGDPEHASVIARTKSSRSRSSSKVRDGHDEAVIKSGTAVSGKGEDGDAGLGGGKDKDRDSERLDGRVNDDEEKVCKKDHHRKDGSRTSSPPPASSSKTARFDSLLKQVKTTADGLPSTASSIASSPGSKANLKGPDSDWSPDGLQQKRVLDGIASIRSVLGQREAGSGDGMTIQQVTLGLDHRLKGANETLKEVKSTLHVIEKRLEKAQKQGPSPGSGPSSERHEEMLLLLKAVKAQLAANLPGLEMKISEIGAQQEKILAGHQRVPASESLLDLGPIQRQLDDLIKLTSSTQAVMKAGVLNKDVHSEITRLISLMEGDRAHREQQLLQQADSVRYLNELNTWLEAFVNNGASHIQSLATSIDKLCADLGPVTTLNDCAGSSSLNLLNDVRQLVLGMKARDQNMASLQAALNDLIVAIGSETRHGAGTTTLARLMETQKRNQESMLKAFTDEISDEIKGERLRFVEAMKEATAINVQLHVEQLKKEMGKEVFVMAKEVERLHRDKQEVELRIADLMAFYSKQQQLASDTQNTMPSMQPVPDLRMKPLVSSHGGHTTSRSHRRQTAYVAAPARPLPLPRGSY